jgi:sulfhydrogenase subunit delta
MNQQTAKPRLAVHKFSSCDGCQVVLINQGEILLALAERVEIVHFAEAGPVDETAEVDIALVEGSISTPHEIERIERIRAASKILITIGACATAGGIQSLRNLAPDNQWLSAIYSHPEAIAILPDVMPIASKVRVDYALHGCPINGGQLLQLLQDLLRGLRPALTRDKVCSECKRRGYPCVAVSQGEGCLGPVTLAGCGALCPSVGRGCFGCFGPAPDANPAPLAAHLHARGESSAAIADRFHLIQPIAEPFQQIGSAWRSRS